MSKVKTFLIVLFFGAAPAAALTTTDDPQLQFFASCAGRLSAVMEFQWTYDTGSADQTQRQRSEMITLVNAVMPAEAGRDVLLMRVDAKHAQANLLRRALINEDPSDAAWAQARADEMLTECLSVLLH